MNTKQNLVRHRRNVRCPSSSLAIVAMAYLASCSPNSVEPASPVMVEALPNRFAAIVYSDAHTPEWGGSEKIYQQTCAYCHDTNVAPQIVGVGWPAEYMPELVRAGRNGMPAFRQTDISDDELVALSKWIEESEVPEGGVEP